MSEAEGSWRRRASTLVLITLSLVVLADILFYRAPLGFTVGLYALALLLALVIRGGRFLRTTPGRVVAAAVVGLAVSCALEPGPLTVALLLVGLVTLGLIDRIGWTSRPVAWLLRWLWFFGRMFTQVSKDISLRGRARRRGSGRSRAPGRKILVWIIPVVLSMVFLGLFGLANPIVEKWLGKLTDSIGSFFESFSALLHLDRMLLWIIVALVVWALLRVRTRTPAPRAPAAPGSRTGFDRIVSPGVIVRCLVLFNILFLLNNALDSLYLWGGATLPEGMSYPEYARRGAYPLVATALLAAGFVLITFPSGKREKPAGWSTPLVYLWIGQNIFLTASAVFRLSIYVEVFTLTRLRCAAGIWMALVAFGLVTIILRIFLGRSNQWLVRVNFVTALVILFTCCFVNFDGIISNYNVRHCRGISGEGPRADMRYLMDLAPDSIPAIEWLADNLPKEAALKAQSARGLAHRLRGELRDRLEDWRGWTWRRARIAAGDR